MLQILAILEKLQRSFTSTVRSGTHICFFDFFRGNFSNSFFPKLCVESLSFAHIFEYAQLILLFYLVRPQEEVLKQIRECIMLHFYEQPLSSKKAETKKPVSDFEEEGGNPKKRKVEGEDEIKNEKKVYYDIPKDGASDEEFLSATEIEDDPAENEQADGTLTQFEKCLGTCEQADSQTLPKNHITDVTQSEKTLNFCDQTDSQMSPKNPEQNDLQPFENANDTCTQIPTQKTIPEDISTELFESQLSGNSGNLPQVDVPSGGELKNDNLLDDDLETDHLLEWISQEMKFSQNEITDENFNQSAICNGGADLPATSSTEERNMSVTGDVSKNLNQTTLSQWSRGATKVGDQCLLVCTHFPVYFTYAEIGPNMGSEDPDRLAHCPIPLT